MTLKKTQCDGLEVTVSQPGTVKDVLAGEWGGREGRGRGCYWLG